MGMDKLEFAFKIAPYVIEIVELLERSIVGEKRGEARKAVAMAVFQAAHSEHLEVASKLIDETVQARNKKET